MTGGRRGKGARGGSKSGGPIELPFKVLYETFDPERERHGFLLEWKDRRGAVRRMHIGRGDLIAPSAPWLRALMDGGCNVAINRKTQELLTEALAHHEGAKAFASSRCGWFDAPVGRGGAVGRVFLLPELAIGAGADQPVVFVGSTEDAVAPPSSTLKEWQSAVGDQAVDHNRAVFVVGLALAAALLHLTGEHSGGFHLRGPSSIGKSTLLQVAASVWGNKVGGWRMTVNGAEALATASSDMLMALDEIGQADPEDAGQLAYMFANGKGKERMGADRRLEKTSTWRVLFLSTGEVSLPHLMAQVRRRAQAGQEVRFIDLAADAGKGFGVCDLVPEGFSGSEEFIRHLEHAALAHRGALGRAFVKSLVASPDPAVLHQRIEFHRAAWVEDHVDRDARTGVARSGHQAPDGQVRRAGQRFALVYAALMLARERHLLAWPAEQIKAAVAELWHDWLDARGSLGSSEFEQVKDRLRNFIAQSAHRFHSVDGGVELDGSEDIKLSSTNWTTQNAAGLFQPGGIVSRAVYLFNGPTWRQDILDGADRRLIHRALIEAKILLPGKDGMPSCQRKVRGVNARYYMIDPAPLTAGEPAGD